jgi:hypothetical protein
MKRTYDTDMDQPIAEKKQTVIPPNSEQLPRSTNINEWNSLNDFYTAFHNSTQHWDFVKTADELKPYVQDYSKRCSIVIMPVKLFNEFGSFFQYHFDILFGKFKYQLLEIQHNGNPFKFFGNWYLMLSDLKMGRVYIDGPEDEQVVVGLNFDPHQNGPYLLKWQNPSPKLSPHDRLLFAVKDHSITCTWMYNPEVIQKALTEKN